MNFNVWKTLTIAKLLALRKKYVDVDNTKAVNDIDVVLTKLHYAKSRDLSTVLLYMHYASKNVKEITDLIPTAEEVKMFLEEQ